MFNILLNTSQISNVIILKTKQKIHQNKTLSTTFMAWRHYYNCPTYTFPMLPLPSCCKRWKWLRQMSFFMSRRRRYMASHDVNLSIIIHTSMMKRPNEKKHLTLWSCHSSTTHNEKSFSNDSQKSNTIIRCLIVIIGHL